MFKLSHTLALVSHGNKVMPKVLQSRLQQYMNHELSDVQARFRKGRATRDQIQVDFTKGRGTRDQIANLGWIVEKAREFQKISITAFLTMPKPLTVWITINCGKF